jgi:hypothetical protein
MALIKNILLTEKMTRFTFATRDGADKCVALSWICALWAGTVKTPAFPVKKCTFFFYSFQVFTYATRDGAEKCVYIRLDP